MQLLEEKIAQCGRILPGDVLKVDSFLNHQIDISLYQAMGQEFARRFAGRPINKILTIEASGIGLACITAQYFHNAPVVFAKKNKSSNVGSDFYTAKVASYTHGVTYDILVSKSYLSPDDHVLIIDDFLANGKAVQAPEGDFGIRGGDARGRGHRRGKGLPAGRTRPAPGGHPGSKASPSWNTWTPIRERSSSGIKLYAAKIPLPRRGRGRETPGLCLCQPVQGTRGL